MQNFTRSILLSWLLMSAVGSAPTVNAQPPLAWKFTEGQTFKLERVIHRKQSVEAKRKSFTEESTSTWITGLHVRKVTAKEITLEQTIISVGHKNAKPADAEQILMKKLADKMTKLSFVVVVTPAGRIREFQGYDDFIKKLGASVPEAKPSLRFLMPETVLRDSLEESLGFLPVGDEKRWTRQAVEPLTPFGSLKMDLEYSRDGKQKGLDAIAYTMQVSYVLPTQDLGLIQVTKGEVKADEAKGLVLFDADQGMLVRGERQLRLHGKLRLETAGSPRSEIGLASDIRVEWRVLKQ